MEQTILVDIFTAWQRYRMGALTFSIGIVLYYFAFLGVRYLCGILTRKNKKQKKSGRRYIQADFLHVFRNAFLLWVFAIYFFMVISLTLFSREPGSRGTMNLALFSSLDRSFPETVENFLMLLPAGIILPMMIPLFRKWYAGMPFGFLFSFAIESIQLATGCGYFELDDILFNGAGFMIGYVLYRFAVFLFGEESKIGR